MAVGECAFDLPHNKWGAIWAGMTGLNTDGARVSDVMWWIDQTNSTINGSSPQAFGSRHSGGAYFVFCDGSVHFFSDGADITTLRFMAGRNDGVVVNNGPN
jgi:prepilin-type processing-associated H-X9-DG protein